MQLVKRLLLGIFLFSVAAQPVMAQTTRTTEKSPGFLAQVGDALLSTASRVVTLNNPVQFRTVKKGFRVEETPTFSVSVPQKNSSALEASAEDALTAGNEHVTARLIEPQGKGSVPVRITKTAEGTYAVSPATPLPVRGTYTLEVSANESFLYTRTITQDFSWGVIAVNMNKSVYVKGDTAWLSFGVVDDAGHTVCNAKLTAVITSPQNTQTTLSTENKTIQIANPCKRDSYSEKPDYAASYITKGVGTYSIQVTAETKNGVKEVADSFQVKPAKDVPYEIERTQFPSRIYPPPPYPVTLTIRAHQDFQGSITDSVPGSFQISEQKAQLYTVQSHVFKDQDYLPSVACNGVILSDSEGSRLSATSDRDSSVAPQNDKTKTNLLTRQPVNNSTIQQSNNFLCNPTDRQTLSWNNVTLHKGDVLTLTYTIKFPPTSPDFYLLGPAILRHSELVSESFSNNQEMLKPVQHDSTQAAVFTEQRQWQVAADTPSNILFMETPDALNNTTGDGKNQLWGGGSAPTTTYDTTIKHSGNGSWKADGTGGSSSAFLASTGSCGGSGGRVSMYIYLDTTPTGSTDILHCTSSGGLYVGIGVNTSRQLLLTSNVTTIATSSTALSTGTWYRITLSYTVTSSTVNQEKVYLNGAEVTDLATTNASLSSAGSASTLAVGVISTTGGTKMHLEDVYSDDDTSLADTGDIRVTAKRPNANGSSNQFTTQIGSGGSGYGTGHSPQVNERPLSTTNGWQSPSSSSTLTESYAIESASQGDTDISSGSNTIVGYTGWIYAGISSGSGGGPTNTMYINGTAGSISLGASPAIFASSVLSSTYPATSPVIGMTESGTHKLGGLYEAGMMIAYIPPPQITISGVAYTNESGSLWTGAGQCDGSTQNISLSVNGGTKVSTSCNASTGAFSFSNILITVGQSIAIYMDTGGGNKGVLYTTAPTSDLTGLSLIQNEVRVRSDSGNMTNALIGNYASAQDSDIPATVSSGALTVASGDELHIETSQTFAPGGDVSTDKLHVQGTYTGGSEVLTISGSGTGTSRPLYVDGGTYTGNSNTTRFTGSSATAVDTRAVFNTLEIKIQPTSGSPTYTLGTASSQTLRVGGDLTLGDGTHAVIVTASTYNPTINISGNVTLNASLTYTKGTGTTTLSPTGTKTLTDNNSTKQNLGIVSISSGTSTPTINLGSSIKADTITIAASHALNANGSNTITLVGSSGPLLSNSGTFTASTGTVVFSPGTSTSLTSGTLTFNNLTYDASGNTGTLGSAITINGNMAVNNGKLADGGNQITGNATGTETVAAGAELQIGTTSVNTNPPSNYPLANITYDPASTVTIEATGGAYSVGGTYGNLNLGTIADTATGETFTLASTLTINGVLTVGNASSTNADTLSLGTGKTLNLNASGTPLVITSKGAFNPQTSTVNYNGTGTTTIAPVTYYILADTGSSARTLIFPGGSTTTIAANGSLTLTGASGNLLTMASSDGTDWNLNVNATGTTTSISYVSVSHSNASGGKQIDASDGTSTNGGNNTNWLFPAGGGGGISIGQGVTIHQGVTIKSL